MMLQCPVAPLGMQPCAELALRRAYQKVQGGIVRGACMGLVTHTWQDDVAQHYPLASTTLANGPRVLATHEGHSSSGKASCHTSASPFSLVPAGKMLPRLVNTQVLNMSIKTIRRAIVAICAATAKWGLLVWESRTI